MKSLAAVIIACSLVVSALIVAQPRSGAAAIARSGAAMAGSVPGISLADLPLDSYFHTSYDMKNFPSSSGGVIVTSGKLVADVVPAGQALLFTGIELRGNQTSSNNWNDHYEFALSVNGRPIYKGDGSARPLRPVLLRPGDSYIIEIPSNTSANDFYDLVVSGYLFDSTLL